MRVLAQLLLLAVGAWATTDVSLHSATWQRVPAASHARARFFAAGAILPAHGALPPRLAVLGGLADAEHALCDIDTLDLRTLNWTAVQRGCGDGPLGADAVMPFARYAHTAVYSATREAVLLHGGAHVNRVNHRIGLLSHTSRYAVGAGGYAELRPQDVREYHPPPRSEHTAVLHVTNDAHELMVVYGGRGNGLRWIRGDVIIMDISRTVWKISTPGRNVSGHSAVMHDGKMYTFGGSDGNGYFYHDLAVFDVEKETWSTPPTTGGPPERRMHASFVPVRLGDEPQGHASYALLFGGFGLKEDPFEAVEAAEAAAKANHEDEQGEWQDTREKMFVTGLWRLDFDTMSWSQLVDTSEDGIAPPQLYWPLATFHFDTTEKQHSVIVYGGAKNDKNSVAESDVYRLILNHCAPGVTGPKCDINIDCSELNDCTDDHGVCVGDQVCRCRPGYEGKSCETFNCNFLYDCSGHGKCVGPNECECESGFKGDGCDLSLTKKSRNGGSPANNDNGNTNQMPLSDQSVVANDDDNRPKNSSRPGTANLPSNKNALWALLSVIAVAALIVYCIGRATQPYTNQPGLVARSSPNVYQKDAVV